MNNIYQDATNHVIETFSAARPDLMKVDVYKKIGEILARLVGRKTPYSYSYVLAVANGKLDPGEPFQDAIIQLVSADDLLPPARAELVRQGFAPVTVLARPDRVPSGAIIQGQAIECRRPNCHTLFVPNVPNKIYCSASCRRRHYKEIR